MARKVFITSDMSVDKRLGVIAETDPISALLWPWLLTVFDDWGRAKADAWELRVKVFPANGMVDRDTVEKALTQYSEAGLIQVYEVEGKRYMAIPPDKWFKYQTHIRREKRQKDDSKLPAPPQLRESARRCANMREKARENIPSPSPSPSPSLSDVHRSSAADEKHSTINTPDGDEAAAAAEQRNAAWDKIQARFAELTGRIISSPIDARDINEALELADGRADLIIAVMEEVVKRYKSKAKGGKINSFSYFLQPLEEKIACLKARASPSAVPAKRARSGTMIGEIMSGLPPDLRGEKFGEPEDDLNRFITPACPSTG